MINITVFGNSSSHTRKGTSLARLSFVHVNSGKEVKMRR